MMVSVNILWKRLELFHILGQTEETSFAWFANVGLGFFSLTFWGNEADVFAKPTRETSLFPYLFNPLTVSANVSGRQRCCI